MGRVARSAVVMSKRSAGWSPAGVASLALWTETEPGYIFSDAAGTTPAVVGGKIAHKASRKVGLPSRSQATGSKQPTYTETGCDHAATTILTGDAVAFTGAFTVYWTGTTGRHQAGNQTISGQVYPATHSTQQTFFGPQNHATFYVENDAAQIISTTALHWPGKVVGRLRRNAANQMYFQMSGSAGEKLIGTLSGTFTFDSEGDVFGFNSCDVCLNDTLMFSADLVTADPTANANVLSYLERRDSAYVFGPATITRKMIVEGDSISCGNTTPGTEWGWNNQILHQLTYGYRPTVYATGGQTMAGIKAEASYSTYGPTLGASDVVTLMAGTNDSFSASALTDLLDWATACKAAIGSARLLICTGLPRYVNDTLRQTYNQGIRDNAASIGYTVVDWGSDALMGQAGDYLDTTYYPDEIHPNIAGHARGVAEYWLPAIEALG